MYLLVVNENGYGVLLNDDHNLRHRGRLGNKSIKTKNGNAVAFCLVEDLEQTVYVLSANGKITKFPVDELRILGTNSQGCVIMNLENGDFVVDVMVS